MSLELLEALEAARAFEATHRFEHLSEFHVPFDELTHSEATESALRTLAERQGKVALVDAKQSAGGAYAPPALELLDLRQD